MCLDKRVPSRQGERAEEIGKRALGAWVEVRLGQIYDEETSGSLQESGDKDGSNLAHAESELRNISASLPVGCDHDTQACVRTLHRIDSLAQPELMQPCACRPQQRLRDLLPLPPH